MLQMKADVLDALNCYNNVAGAGPPVKFPHSFQLTQGLENDVLKDIRKIYKFNTTSYKKNKTNKNNFVHAAVIEDLRCR